MRPSVSSPPHQTAGRQVRQMTIVPEVKATASDANASGAKSGPKHVLTTLQMVPVNAPNEMVNAIQRQRRTSGITYWKSHPAKPVYRALISGVLQPKASQCAPLSKRGPNTVDNGPPSPDQACVVKGSGVMSGNTGRENYNVLYDKNGRLKSLIVNGDPTVKGGGRVYNFTPNVSAPRCRKLPSKDVAHSISDYPDGYNRSFTTYPLSGSAPDATLKSTQNYIPAPKEGWKEAYPTKTSANGAIPSVTTSHSSRHQENKKTGSAPGDSLQGLSCVQLAYSILGSVGSEFGGMYSLCRSKLRYAEFIEISQPHRLREETTKTNTNGKTVHTGPRTKARSTSSPTTATNPGNVLPILSLTTKPLTPLTNLAENGAKDKGNAEKSSEPEIDYDKPIKIIVESNEPFTRAKRPILKSRKSDNSLDISSDRNNNSHQHRGLYDGPGVASCSDVDLDFGSVKDKSRLVRFNPSHRVHEFTPSEPVNPNGYA